MVAKNLLGIEGDRGISHEFPWNPFEKTTDQPITNCYRSRSVVRTLTCHQPLKDIVIHGPRLAGTGSAQGGCGQLGSGNPQPLIL